MGFLCDQHGVDSVVKGLGQQLAFVRGVFKAVNHDHRLDNSHCPLNRDASFGLAIFPADQGKRSMCNFDCGRQLPQMPYFQCSVAEQETRGELRPWRVRGDPAPGG